MNSLLAAACDRLLRVSRLEYWPVHVRRGFAAGARWTLYPYSGYWRGMQEPAMHEALFALGDISGWSCWDLGAHFGIYAVGLARRVGPAGEVAAFEPNPFSYARLERHRRMNRLTNLRTFPAAVSDLEGTTAFYTYGSLRHTATHLPYEGETADHATHPIEVKTLVLDELVAAGRLRQPDFIKIDVEGHAHRALAGARESLAAKRPILVVALHSPAESAGVTAILEPLGYRSTPIATHSASSDAVVGHDLLFTPEPR